MENEQKSPQQDSAPLTAKKKQALLEYLAVLCAGAFLIVALSLGIKLIAVQNDMEAADLGARENIAALQDNLDRETAKSKALQEELSSAQSTAELAQNALKEAKSEADAAKLAQSELEEKLKAAEEKQAQAQRRADATELLLQAHTAFSEGNWQVFAARMRELSACAGDLSDSAAQQYAALKQYLS